MKKRSRPGKPPSLRFILTFYDAYSRTRNIAKVAAVLDTTGPALQAKIDKWEDLQIAQEVANAYRHTQTLSGYVFSTLSKQAQETWKAIGQASDRDTVNNILSRKTKEMRQELFIYALVSSSYDLSAACRLVGMDRSGLAKWKHDLNFQRLLEECQWHKKNFFESSLVGLVEERHPGAVIFVNRTLNADRGYSEKVQVEHTGEISTGGFQLADLDLDMETRKKILAAIRQKKLETQQRPAIAIQSEVAAA